MGDGGQLLVSPKGQNTNPAFEKLCEFSNNLGGKFDTVWQFMKNLSELKPERWEPLFKVVQDLSSQGLREADITTWLEEAGSLSMTDFTNLKLFLQGLERDTLAEILLLKLMGVSLEVLEADLIVLLATLLDYQCSPRCNNMCIRKVV
ncbi:hypothetical protein GOP47_0019031 [Adiantum capillus-veneris]|uniref:Uncharacterized protein n=1 Tax=Adiantum capillus-veneris TaxID=13818 RepID=A0A9D4UEU2_ADICA|nr:hypothetical protein GOP47_0019031 [Adiantum capillus-veneris]